MTKNLITFLLCCFMAFAASAQRITVTGTVTDAEGEPLIGASVSDKNTPGTGAVTDLDGRYSISVDTNGTLEFSYIGFTTKEESVNGRTAVDVVLESNSSALDEVVVVGYGVQKKSSMTASVSSVSAKEISKQVTSNVASALLGQAPGVEVLQDGGEAGANVSILIRGAGTFGSTEPLYVIDGAISNNGLNSLNPADIKSIEVLKDGSAAAIYGSRAANGVVLVTTKNGQAGKTKVELNATYTYQTPSKKLDFMNASQWREYANMVADNSPAFERAPENVNPTDPNRSTDWQDIYYRNASMYNLSAVVSGGNENSTFATSLGYSDQEGIIIQSDYQRYNARVNGTYRIGRFLITENLSVAHTKKRSAPSSRGILIPTVPVTDEQGRYISTPLALGYSLTNSDITNPLAGMYARDAYTKNVDVTGNIGVEADIWGGIKYKINFAGSYLNSRSYNHTPEYASYWNEDGTPDSNFWQPYTSLDESRYHNFNYTLDNLLTWRRTFGDHDFDVLLGTSWMREFYRFMSISSGNNDLGGSTINTYNGAGTIGSDEQNSALLSFFGRANYAFAGRYLLSASIRRDESSKFAKNHRVGYFPAVSVGWNVHSEPWFPLTPQSVSKLKLRASWGELGANFIDPYSFLSLAYGPVPVIFGDKRQNAIVTWLKESTLSWEKSISKNIALEMSFLNNSLDFTVEYFDKRNNDLLAPLESLPSSGQTIVINNSDLPYYNTASVRNRGWELSAGYRKTFGDWNIGITGNISFLDNEVLKLGNGVKPIRGSHMSSKFSDRPTITMEGLPIGTFWGYEVAGIDSNGDFLFLAEDGTSKTAAEVSDTDKRVLGNPTPDFTYGLNINLGWKDWDFTAFFQGTHGNEIFAAAKYQYYFNSDNNCLVDAMNAWRPDNTDTSIPIAKTDNYGGGNSLPSSFYIEDGSYFRCKNLQLGYTIPQNLLRRTGCLSHVRIYASVQNLFTITKYPLYDPEVGSNTLFNRGVDGLQNDAPRVNARTYNFGINITF